MADTRSPEQRSKIMSAVGTKDTGPEMIVRRILHAAGCRYGLHRRDLPGSPDVVMPSRKKIVFVHGCFWHGHKCRYGRPPKSRSEYWLPKLTANALRDKLNQSRLAKAGWSVLVVWQCETRRPIRLKEKLIRFVQTENRPIVDRRRH